MSRTAIATLRNWNQRFFQEFIEKEFSEWILIDNKGDLNKDFLLKNDISRIYFPHWSYIIKKDIYESFECIMFHMTDLPFGRGGSPLQNLVSRGYEQTKVSAFRCAAGVDTGDIYLKKDMSLLGNAEEIFCRFCEIASSMILEIENKKLKPEPQFGDITMFDRRKPDQSNLEACKSLKEIFNYIRMLDADGYPKAFFEIDGVKLEFSRASFRGDNIISDVKITLSKEE